MCHPLYRRVQCHGLLLQPLHEAGDGDTCIAFPSTKLAIHGEDISSGRGTDVPATRTFLQAVTPLLVCFHGGSTRYLPHKQVSHRSFQPLVQCSRPPLARCCRESADAREPCVQNTFNLIGLFTLPLSHSFSREIELTENQCQSVSVCLGETPRETTLALWVFVHEGIDWYIRFGGATRCPCARCRSYFGGTLHCTTHVFPEGPWIAYILPLRRWSWATSRGGLWWLGPYCLLSLSLVAFVFSAII